jgi:hypothetical protein
MSRRPAKQRDLVRHGVRPSLVTRMPASIVSGKLIGRKVAARRLDDETDDVALADVEPALVDEMLVHHRVEVRVVRHVVDVAVGVVVHPARGDREEVAVVRARVLASDRSSRLDSIRSPNIRSSSSSIQWRTGTCAPTRGA